MGSHSVYKNGKWSNWSLSKQDWKIYVGHVGPYFTEGPFFTSSDQIFWTARKESPAVLIKWSSMTLFYSFFRTSFVVVLSLSILWIKGPFLTVAKKLLLSARAIKNVGGLIKKKLLKVNVVEQPTHFLAYQEVSIAVIHLTPSKPLPPIQPRKSFFFEFFH